MELAVDPDEVHRIGDQGEEDSAEHDPLGASGAADEGHAADDRSGDRFEHERSAQGGLAGSDPGGEQDSGQGGGGAACGIDADQHGERAHPRKARRRKIAADGVDVPPHSRAALNKHK